MERELLELILTAEVLILADLDRQRLESAKAQPGKQVLPYDSFQNAINRVYEARRQTIDRFLLLRESGDRNTSDSSQG